ncbi:MAG: hypothetical protein ACKVUS_21575 [Saprospiraceae bacterium]
MKKTLCHKIILSAVFGLLPSLSFAQWTALPTPIGPGIFYDMTAHKQSVYTTLYKNFQIRVARTNDNIHWEQAALLPTNLQSVTPRSFSDGDRLYVTGKNDQFNTFLAFVSNDDGANWTTLSWPNQTKTDLFEAWGSTLLAVNDSVIQRSGNSGGDWQTVFQTQGKVYDLKRIGDQAWLMTTETRLYRSTDDGLTWQESIAPYNAAGLNLPELPIYPTEIGAFVQFYNAGIGTLYRSINLGESWADFPIPVPSISDMLFLNGKLYLKNSSLWSSADEGGTWAQVGIPSSWVFEKLGNTLCLGATDGFFKSADEGQNWWTGNVGLDIALGQVPSSSILPSLLEYHNGKLYLINLHEGYVTENEGVEWRFFRSNSFSTSSRFFAKGDSIIILGDGATLSFDNGDTWELIPGSTNAYHPLSGAFEFTSTDTHLFASVWFSDSIYRSSDWGLNWASLNLPPNVFSLEFVAGAGNALYITDGYDVYFSPDNGQSFSLANNGLGSNPYIQGLWGVEDIPFASANDQLYRRENNLWKPATAGLYDDQGNLPYIVEITGDAGRMLLAGSKQMIADPLLFISDDNGQSWSGGWELGLPPIEYQFVATLYGSTIYACGELGGTSSGLGLWKRDVSVGSDEPSTPHTLACTIRPNPVSDAAWLVFEKTPDAPCSVRVQDALGRLKWRGTVSGESLQIPVASWPNGLYEVVVQNEKGEWATQRLVVQH